MQASNKTPADLAAACGVSVQAVYKWLKDPLINLKNEHLFAVADLMRYEARWIATGKALPQPAVTEPEQAILDNYRAVGDPEKVAIEKVAESLARPYIAAPGALPTKAPAVTKAPEQINDNPGRLPDEHLHIKFYGAADAKSERKKTAGGKPAVED